MRKLPQMPPAGPFYTCVGLGDDSMLTGRGQPHNLLSFDPAGDPQLACCNCAGAQQRCKAVAIDADAAYASLLSKLGAPGAMQQLHRSCIWAMRARFKWYR
jgi:hypothetical protein